MFLQEELLKQTSLTDQLTSIANSIKSIPNQKRKVALERDISSLKTVRFWFILATDSFSLLIFKLLLIQGRAIST
jgi:hypothetical protein